MRFEIVSRERVVERVNDEYEKGERQIIFYTTIR